MKKTVYRVLSFLIPVLFACYWIANIQLALPGSRGSIIPVPAFNYFIAYRWGFFKYPPTGNNRLYLVIRDTRTQAVTDSLELIQPLTDAKRAHIPFNQKENIMDHLLFHASAKIIQVAPDSSGAAYDAVKGDIRTLEAYVHTVVKQQGVDTVFREYRLVVAQVPVAPFSERNNQLYRVSERIYYKTPYQPFGK